MFSFTDHLLAEETGKKKTLHAFDMDETLISHDHNKMRVHVLNPEGQRVRSLTNQEFNNHKLPEGHKYDFSEFTSSDAFGQSAKPIKHMINKMNALHKKNPSHVKIVTARSDMDDQQKFAHHMAKYGIDINQIHVHRAGNIGSNPAENKKRVIDDLIKKHNYKSAHMYDDSEDNLKAFLALKSQHPEVELNAHHIQADGSIKHTKITPKTKTPEKKTKKKKAK